MDRDGENYNEDDDEGEDDFNLATMKCDSNDEDYGDNCSNDMKRHLIKCYVTYDMFNDHMTQ